MRPGSDGRILINGLKRLLPLGSENTFAETSGIR